MTLWETLLGSSTQLSPKDLYKITQLMSPTHFHLPAVLWAGSFPPRLPPASPPPSVSLPLLPFLLPPPTFSPLHSSDITNIFVSQLCLTHFFQAILSRRIKC